MTAATAAVLITMACAAAGRLLGLADLAYFQGWTWQEYAGRGALQPLDEMAARVVQHELDHLDGVLMLERTDDESRKAALATLRRSL